MNANVLVNGVSQLAPLDPSRPVVEVGCGETIEIDKMYGPLVFWSIRVTADRETVEWVVEREFGPEGEWSEVTRIPGQLVSDFIDSEDGP